MKCYVIALFLSLQAAAHHDSLKKQQFYIHTMPSNLLAGDLSLGFEQVCNKRVSYEFQAYLKCFSPVFLRYDKGFRFNYQLKYNFIDRSYFRMSANLSASYKEARFANKKDYWPENGPYDTDITPTYYMDRAFQQFGIGGGIGLNLKLSRHIFIGSDLLLELCKTKRSYTVLAQENRNNGILVYQRTEPYVYTEQAFSGFLYLLPVINIKLSYRF